MIHTRKTLVTLLVLALSCAGLPVYAAGKESVSPGQNTLKAEGAVLDAHTHLISQHLLDGLTGGGVPTGGAEDLIAKLDAANVKKAVVLALGYWTLPDDSNMAAENDFTAAEVARFPDRLMGFCGINPRYDTALDEIDRCLSLPGMLGVKMQGGEFDWEDPELVSAISAVLKKAGEEDAPVLLHVNGAPLDAKEVKNVFKTLGENQGTRIMLAHVGGLADWEIESYLLSQVVVPPILNPENLFMDLSASLKFYQDAPLSKREMMVWRFRKWGIDKLLFGSDYLNVAPIQTPSEALETLTRYPFTQDELDTILGNDAAAWLYGKSAEGNGG